MFLKRSTAPFMRFRSRKKGCWVALTNPTATEIFQISERFGIEVDHLRAPLDEEERARIEAEDNYTLILVDIPMIEERNDKNWTARSL